MQNDKNHLTMYSEEIKGNNPYLLNRMTVDPSFKRPQCDINTMVGYGADGKVISNTDHYNPFATRISSNGFEDMTKSSGSLVSANTQRTQWSFIDRPDRNLKADLDEIKALTSTPTASHVAPTPVKKSKSSAQKQQKHKKSDRPATVPDWRLAFKSSNVHNEENSLQKLTEERYSVILGAKVPKNP